MLLWLLALALALALALGLGLGLKCILCSYICVIQELSEFKCITYN